MGGCGAPIEEGDIVRSTNGACIFLSGSCINGHNFKVQLILILINLTCTDQNNLDFVLVLKFGPKVFETLGLFLDTWERIKRIKMCGLVTC